MIIIKNNDDKNLYMNVGQKIKEIRKEKGLSLKDLSEITDLSVGYLSNVERNINSPTISSLRKIVDAFNLTVPELLTREKPKNRIIRKDERIQLIRNQNEGLKYELLTSDINRKMEPLLLTVQPGSSSGKEEHSHTGEEFGFIIKGKLTYWINEVKYNLEEGDTIYYSAHLPHRYANESDEECVSLWCVTPPSF